MMEPILDFGIDHNYPYYIDKNYFFLPFECITDSNVYVIVI